MWTLGYGPLFWLIAGFVLFVLEAVTPGAFFLGFFGLGAWFVLLLTAFLPLPVWAQWAFFSAVSVVSLVLLRKRLILFLAARKAPKTDSLSEPMVADRYLGKEVQVVSAVIPGRTGTVEFDGTHWQAKSGVALREGDRARIRGLEGLAFLLEPLEAPSPAGAPTSSGAVPADSGGASPE
ncbi:MAG: NfeD family protein [Deltaproteobacteria bacterium]|jgi:membrane protein implicated in regulation of membrane protease activity|nr:NfeD family protein [Deltaproteobacteria bacterium]